MKFTQTKLRRMQAGLPPQPRRLIGRCSCGKEIWASAGQIIRDDKCRHRRNINTQ